MFCRSTWLAFAFAALWLAVPLPALSQETETAFAPPPGVPGISPGQFVEEYVAIVLLPLRRADWGRDGLDQGDIDRLKNASLSHSRANRINELLAHDLNGDGVVTSAEVRRIKAARYGGSGEREKLILEKEIAKLMQYDADGDGIVTYAEMLLDDEASRGNAEAVVRSVVPLLALDPNKDGRLTGSELTALAQAWYAAADADGDGHIGADEFTAVANSSRPASPPVRPIPCPLPKPAAGDLLVAYAAPPSPLASVSVAGPDRATSTTRVTIEAGSPPIFLILSSRATMIWRIDGAVDRLSRVVVLSDFIGSGGKPWAGLTGLDRSRADFIDPRVCRLWFDTPSGRDRQIAEATLEKVLLRPAKILVGQKKAARVMLPSGAVAEQLDRSPPAPPGLDSGVWKEGLLFHPGGIVAIDPETVVSPSPVSAYDVLPDWMGLAQLVGEGVLQPIGTRDFRIVRPLKRFPAGLYGESVRFLVGKGVPTPSGDLGHSCVVSEETGLPIGEGSCD